MRILVATDAWRPQVNGVVRTYEHVLARAALYGAEISLLTPDDFLTVPCPSYPEIRLALPGFVRAAEKLDAAGADAVHIATEGPIGLMTRSWCLSNRVPFTTCFHTRFPDYVKARCGFPRRWTYAMLRRFHNAGAGVMVATESLARELESRGFRRLRHWSRGVDTELFRPRPVRQFGTDRPVLLYVGRVAVEKNLEAFLRLDTPGRKVVVGDGPQLGQLRAAHPDVLFTGIKLGHELAACYASADVFVFPSRTDTFGMVLLEAMASGLPIAAYPVMGPIDLVTPGETGCLSEDLGSAVRQALTLDRTRIRRCALAYSWEDATRAFVAINKAAAMAQGEAQAVEKPIGLARRPEAV